MSGIWRTSSIAAMALVVSGCVSQTAYNAAVTRLDLHWKERNDRTFERQGRRTIEANRYHAFIAAQASIRRLGMFVEEQNYQTGYVKASAPAPVPLTATEWETVRRTDTPDMRSVIVSEVGPLGYLAPLDATGKDVLVNVFVTERADGVEVALGMRLRDNQPGSSGRAKRSQAPPTAVSIGLGKFWSVFENELRAVMADNPAPPQPTALARRKLGTARKSRPTRTATGLFVSSEGHVLTDSHVVEGCSALRVGSGEAERRTAELAAVDRDNHLALLQFPGNPGDIAMFREGPGIRPGDKVVVVGYPLRAPLSSSATVTAGTVNAVVGAGNDPRLVQVDAPVPPGNGGGPLIDEGGNVVGIVVDKRDGLVLASASGGIPRSVTFAVKATVARTFLDTHGVDYATSKSSWQFSPDQIGELARRFVAMVECWK